jgi:Spy/CpxP family protein refolding chaperone
MSRSLLPRSFALLSVVSFWSGSVFAQADTSTPADRPAAAAAADSTPSNAEAGNGRMRRGQGGGRGNFDPAEIQQRIMTAMREQFSVTDDAEWKAISDRITAVTELRRATGGGFGAMRGAQGGAPGGRRGMAASSPEQDALRQAIADKLPDAEIKSRLARLREARKANEEKLTKAQEELRAVLTVRQEAVAVMFGLLP